jgi:protein tyrosine/serine phosphatase
MKLRLLFASLAASVLLAEEPVRPEKFARPIETPGLPNLHQVTPQLYRSAQPSLEGFRAAEKMGIRTVISLRDDAADDELTAGTKLKLIRIPMSLSSVEDAAIARILAALAKKEDGPFLVHCQLGADRTGAAIAMWRVTAQGWTRDDAIAEMRACGLGLIGFATYVANADLGRLKIPPEGK